ncbi:hypothetical protein Asp14428_41870 [Actinoplanes sp. NBRC 14428]|nr:hypothetical protein Asp14428_41870 [Actinoplanes sp. NBRC 14428]
MTDTTEEQFFLLLDPEWLPEDEEDVPPFEAVVGMWPLDADGSPGRFRSNPEYRPVTDNSPSDPIDALLRLAMRGDAEIEQLQLVLRDCLMDQAMNGDGRPLIVRFDDHPCAIVATSTPHRDRIASPDWRRAGLDEVVAALADGTDLLFNPGGPAAVRLTGDFVRATVTMDEDELAGARATFRRDGGLDGGTGEDTRGRADAG